ncbi:hypothetical protein Q4602_03390 [Paraglaciecola chathamensis]|uniref:hypothetical protein n=1 Tax=Paraglaciecola chathamensis TaxID=368405 RepID=UPI00270F0DB7|nr:hypothetical protein [Paraglaciecola chathamensis]MDO6838504.1 hypothetical protein [Paraglaciecola chathamensis]
MITTSFPDDPLLLVEDLPSIVTNHTGYPLGNSANWKLDDTGCVSNYSGCQDMMWSADWTEGYYY